MNTKWRKPELKVYATKDVLSRISANARSSGSWTIIPCYDWLVEVQWCSPTWNGKPQPG